ncbi:long-chain-fatty-acyl-CoA reductase [Pseudomaricurvus alkylphenolicus]|uniref:acyl-CoA reductase n=1 Tax=Pseudomaricurvus alkylphenolicus TaxID=1306991 RepID=UPI00141FFE9C|nr:acyl-CoA reductase [Pseudomaricurvus alkylphenolicus]NIB41703.1 long-chain-fatty-acyl-CoA reductase [Pseudomaricurvus alkylphenolicus]
MTTYVKIPLIIRGEIIEDYDIEHRDRSGESTLLTPDVSKYSAQLLSDNSQSLMDLYDISYDDIVEFLCALGQRLDLDHNPYWREAFEQSKRISNLSDAVMEFYYRGATRVFNKAAIDEIVENRLGGSRYLESWVSHKLIDGRTLSLRALGARAIHVIAGNLPGVAMSTVMRSALTRSDTIIKLPSNDPLTALAIVRTMIDMAPDHPLTKHFSAAYWKGGDEKVEEKIYQPQFIEKIVAWGGLNSVKHITKYLQPGIDLITLDPKSSTSLIGSEVFSSESTMREVARRAAADMGGLDQEACLNARVMYLESGTDAEGIERANKFGKYLYEALQQLPSTISNGPKRFDPALKAEINSVIDLADWYRVYADEQGLEKGAVIVSQLGEAVDFSALLSGRVGNIVPVDAIDDALDNFSAYTQTVGIYPDSLKTRIRTRAALCGGQMITSLGYATRASGAGPQDAIEPIRRMCKWIADSTCDPLSVPGPWMHPSEYS